jgi:hypothetical protein
LDLVEVSLGIDIGTRALWVPEKEIPLFPVNWILLYFLGIDRKELSLD